MEDYRPSSVGILRRVDSPRRFAIGETPDDSAKFWSEPVLWLFGSGLGLWPLTCHLFLSLCCLDFLQGRRDPGLPRRTGEDRIPVGTPLGHV